MSDGAQYVTRDGLLYDGGKRSADAEWLAAISRWQEHPRCAVTMESMFYEVQHPEDMLTPEVPCDGCIPLRALLKRALDAQGPAPRPPRES